MNTNMISVNFALTLQSSSCCLRKCFCSFITKLSTNFRIDQVSATNFCSIKFRRPPSNAKTFKAYDQEACEMNLWIAIRTIEINHHGNSRLLMLRFISLEITCFGLVHNVKDCLIYTYLHKQHHLLILSLLNIIERNYQN